MIKPPQKEYESVNWHGENLGIDQDKSGFITISRPPYETVFNPAEGEEISQFIHEYRSRPAPSLQQGITTFTYQSLKEHDNQIRNATLDEIERWAHEDGEDCPIAPWIISKKLESLRTPKEQP